MDPRQEHKIHKFSRVTLWVFRVLCLLFVVYFVWAATLQFNDPDWFISVTVYAVSALVTLIAISDRIPYYLPFGVAVGVVIVDGWWMWKLFTTASCLPFQFGWDMCHAAQNLFGYVIIAVWLVVIGVRGVIREYSLISRQFAQLEYVDK